MIKRLISLEDNFSIAKAASIVGFLTLTTKFVALYRERLFAATFGQGTTLDIYFSAFRIPDFLTSLLVLSTLSVAFLPIFTDLLTESKDKAQRLINAVFSLGGTAMAVLCLFLLLLSRPLMHILVPGFSGEDFEQTLKLTRLFMVSPVLFTLVTVFSGVLNAKKKFFITSLAPLLYNVGIIAGVRWLYPAYGTMGLGYGVLLGALLQLGILAAATFRQGFGFSLNFNTETEGLKKLYRLYGPRIFSFDLSNVTLILGSIIGSALTAGSITALNQAYNLQSVPIGVFGYSIAVAAFPALSEHFSRKDIKSFLLTLEQSVSQTLFFIIPISVLVLIYRAYVVRIILGTGNFDWNDTITTFQILGLFSFSYFSQSLTTLLSRAFFAKHNTKTPVLVNICAIGINLLFGLILGKTFGILGLTFAFVLASVFNATALFVILRKEMAGEVPPEHPGLLKRFDHELFSSVWKILACSLLLGLVSYGMLKAVAPFVNTRTVLGIMLQCAISAAAGLAVFLVSAHMLKIQQAGKALDFFRKKW